MSKSALNQISTIESLRFAWKELDSRISGKRRENSGIDQISFNEFSKHLDHNLKKIQRYLRSTTGYSFQSLKPHLIPKPNGKRRLICVPTVQDRIVQRTILNFLSDGDKCKILNEVSYGFIKNRTVKNAVSKAKNLRDSRPWVYKSDITSFFDEIDRDILTNSIQVCVKYPSLRALLISVLNCEIFEPNSTRGKTIKKLGIITGKGIRQGMPLSPFFANLILKPFDSSIVAKGHKMVRYADDFVIFSKSENDCNKIHRDCSNALNLLGLQIPRIEEKSKTIIYEPKIAAEFLGMGLVLENNRYKLKVLPEQLKKIQDRILLLADFNKLMHEKITISKLGSKLNGIIGGYIGSYEYADNIEHLISKLSKYRKETLIRILEDGLKLNIDNLSPNQLSFLEINS